MNKKLLLVYNPKAGKGLIKNKLSGIIDIFTKAEYDVTVRPTQRAQDALETVKTRGMEYDLIVCCGGDGTLDETVTGLIKGEINVPLGYIPAGSTNDFGGSLSMPKSMIRAAQNIVDGSNFKCDVGLFNDDVFVYIAAFGLFTDVSYDTPQDIKNVLGHMAYILEGMKRLSTIRSYEMKATYLNENNEEASIEGDFLFGMITNSMSVGGFKRITGKNVKLDDGVFEVTLIKKPNNPMELNDIMVALVDRNINVSSMYCFKTSKITFESVNEVAWTLDGEFGGRHTVVNIENLHKGMDIRVG